MKLWYTEVINKKDYKLNGPEIGFIVYAKYNFLFLYFDFGLKVRSWPVVIPAMALFKIVKSVHALVELIML